MPTYKATFALFVCSWLLATYEPSFVQCDDDVDAGVLRILPLGDSITTHAYRSKLQRLLRSSHIQTKFIGGVCKFCHSEEHQTTLAACVDAREKSIAPPPHCNDYPYQCLGCNPDQDPSISVDHEGHWGWTAQDILDGPSWLPKQFGTLKEWLPTYTFDVALVHLGTNDLVPRTPAQILQSLIDIFTLLRSRNPNVAIFVAQIIPLAAHFYRGDSLQTYIEFNALVNTTLIDLTSTKESPVIAVDHTFDFDPDNDLYDGVHPNESGDAKIAASWYEALVTWHEAETARKFHQEL